jgi:hypothetical protein
VGFHRWRGCDGGEAIKGWSGCLRLNA